MTRVTRPPDPAKLNRDTCSALPRRHHRRPHPGRCSPLVVVALAALCMLLTGLLALWGAVPPARAGARAISVFNKVTLGETSIDGPAFVSTSQVFEGQTTSSSVIAWTGTDGSHHLNVLTSADKLHYGHKITLLETSPYRPAVTQMSPAAGGAVILAWTGSDRSHTLNVLFDVYGSRQKLTLWGETSISAPALALFNGKLLLAWTGPDPSNSLNVLPISLAPLTPGTKTILPLAGSSVGPTLSNVMSDIVLSWTMHPLHLNLATSPDGVHFTPALGPGGSPQLSTSAPDMLFVQREGGPQYYNAWTGTDPAHHLNLQWTANFPLWPDPAHTKTVLADTALGGPQIATNAGLLIAWTGTDGAHHLNVAQFDGS
jgi:hypothetical protein